MAEVRTFVPGGYRYLQGVFQYSAAVAAEAGFEIERARFRRLVALAEGFRAIETHLQKIGRPLTAFCACELRSPAPFTEAGFTSFNREYVGSLGDWGLYDGKANPVARSNVCPEIDAPREPSFYAFSYTVLSPAAQATFVIAGGAECPEGRANYRDYIVRRGDVSAEGVREKARFVRGEMERRMAALGFAWADASATQLYTVHNAAAVLEEELFSHGAAPGGLTWHFARPPVVDLEFEIDVRCVARELLI